VGLVLLVSCGKRTSSSAQDSGQHSAVARPTATDVVICVDNSGSISPAEQALVRETTMLLADLADVGDRISLVSFGRGAHVDVSVLITTDADRISFRDRAKASLGFKENYSDIRAGLRTIAANRDSLIRPTGQANGTVVLLTDGKLETADGKTPAAFDEMLADIRGPLAGVDLYAVALGDTSSRDEILDRNGEAINGQTLLSEYVAGSPDHYFHAISLNQVLDATVQIVNRAKGVNSLGEQGANRFRIDDTVESLSLVVRKKSSDGQLICRSGEIQVDWPGGEPVTAQTAARLLGGSIYWNQGYEFFDLIAFKKPKPGIWAVRLPNGNKPDVLSTVVTPIELRLDKRDSYFLNESASLGAWLFDKRSAALSKVPYRLQAHMAIDGNLRNSNVFVPLAAAVTDGQFLLPVPAALVGAAGGNTATRRFTVEVIAERRKSANSDELDPWFIRRSAPFTIDLVQPFAHWVVQRQNLTRVPVFGWLISYPNPFRGALVPFGAVADPKAPQYPDFLSPPRLSMQLRRSGLPADPAVTQGAGGAADAVFTAGKLVYSLSPALRGTGTYEYVYRLAGNTSRGAFGINSPTFAVSIRYGLEFAAFLGLLLLGLVQLLSDRFARLYGQICGAGAQSSVQRLRKRVEYIRVGGAELRMVARCFVLLFKRIDLHVVKGQAVVNGKRVATGGSVRLPQRKHHTAVLVQADGTQIQLLIQAKSRVL
jgi:hypothetical protein